MTKPNILIIEDEEPIRAGLRDLFLYHGYNVNDVADGESGLQAVEDKDYNMVILDIMLPNMSGFEVCEKLRRHSKTLPIIMLTAKTAEEDIVNGLSLGADDYMGKPFSIRELLLRVQAVLKRTLPQKSDFLKFGESLLVNTSELLGEKDGEVITFTLREVALLQFLANNNFSTKTREEILHEVWGYKQGPEYDTRTVDIHVAKIRRKIEADPKNPEFIRTVRGRGYQLKGCELVSK